MIRPDHPDFWKLSEIMLDLDGHAETVGQAATQEAIDSAGDEDSIIYMAHQRALRIELHHPILALLSDELVPVLMATWLEAFIIGNKFGKS